MPRSKGTGTGGSSQWEKLKSGSNIRYANKETGEIISRRQYIKLTEGHTPEAKAKSRAETGVKRAQTARRDSKRAQQEHAKAFDWLKKNPGATWKEALKQEYDSLSPTQKQTQERHNKEIDKHRRQTIEDRYKRGLMTEREYNSALASMRLEHSYRDKMEKIRDELSRNPNMSSKRREKLQKEYNAYQKQYRKAVDKLRAKDVVPPEGSDFEWSWYHG